MDAVAPFLPTSLDLNRLGLCIQPGKNDTITVTHLKLSDSQYEFGRLLVPNFAMQMGLISKVDCIPEDLLTTTSMLSEGQGS